jgi:hypothetical protein
MYMCARAQTISEIKQDKHCILVGNHLGSKKQQKIEDTMLSISCNPVKRMRRCRSHRVSKQDNKVSI